MDEFRVQSPATGALIDGLTLRLYNPATAEWSLYWANASNGVLSLPPTVGRFADDGSGAFYDEEEIAGRQVLVRYLWTDITPASAHFEQAFSTDRRSDVGTELDLHAVPGGRRLRRGQSPNGVRPRPGRGRPQWRGGRYARGCA